MRYYIFRNHTVEHLFTGIDAVFSGYGDISYIDPGSDGYIFFYHFTINADKNIALAEGDHFLSKIEFLLKQTDRSKPFIIFTVADLFSLTLENSDLRTRKAVDDFNRKIYEIASVEKNVRIIDFGDFVCRFPTDQIISWKYYYTSLIIINPALAKKFQSWLKRKLEALNLFRKKCIVLDLDNTLWGGILGEDGLEGIKIGESYPGNCFSDFQKCIVEASRAGIILALCSKNNEADVLETFEKHDGMILRLEHITTYKINWDNKPSNVIKIARELNIGPESMVFIDDSPVERDLVRSSIPEITVPEFPEQPYELLSFFKKIIEDYFQIYRLTTEDLEKTIQYKENFKRDAFKNAFSTIEDYLKNLDIEITIRHADKFNIARLSQMTQKTNQFNLTARRYSESDLYSFVGRGDLVFCASVKDKFGDNGITLLAIAFLNADSKIAYIDSFLLSCRILGRGIEKVFLSFILNKIYDKGYRTVYASYIPTSRNNQVRGFYEKNGFREAAPVDGEQRYILEMNGKIITESYYKIIYNKDGE